MSRVGGGVGVDLGVEDGVPGTAPTGGALETIRRRMARTEEKASEEGKVGEEKTPQRWETADTCSKILLGWVDHRLERKSFFCLIDRVIETFHIIGLTSQSTQRFRK